MLNARIDQELNKSAGTTERSQSPSSPHWMQEQVKKYNLTPSSKQKVQSEHNKIKKSQHQSAEV